MKIYSIEEIQAMNTHEFALYAGEVMSLAEYDNNDKCINVEFCYQIDSTKWELATAPSWNWSGYFYRIKSKPQYVPYKEVQYVPYKEVQYEWIGKAVIRKADGAGCIILNVYPDTNKMFISSCGICTLAEESLENFTWLDGSPFGEVEQ